MNKIALAYTTTASIDDAEKLASDAVAKKLAACVNIIPQAISIYAWEGAIQKSAECILLFKTNIKNISTLTSWLKENHPYTTPALLADTIDSSPEFFDYIQNHLAS